MTGSAFSFSPDQSTLPPASESPSSSISNKRQFDNAFYSSPPPATFDSPPPTSSYQPGWTNNRRGHSNNYRGGSGGGYSRFPKRSRPYNYQN
jgi:hypothetical protein